jgi:TRAP-type C4-dicarboxylate transport system substrate-binding protein
MLPLPEGIRTGRRAAARACAVVALAAIAWLAPAHATELKIATIAPENSSWMREMRKAAEDVKARTQSRVTLKFYGGGVMGNDKKVLRKIRVGQLDGSTFTPSALAEIYPDLSIYGLPLLFQSLAEVDAVRARMDERMRAGLEEAGFVSFGFAEGGFAKLMSNVPVNGLDDLRGRKIWVPEGDRISYSAMQALGLAPVTLPLTDVLTGLQTGLVDIVATSAVGALVLQWHTKVKYVTDLPVAYIVATLAIAKPAFEELAPEDQAIVREVMEDVYARIDRENRIENEKAEAALAGAGIKSTHPDPDEVREWRRIVAESNHKEGRAGAFDVALLGEIEAQLQTLRTAAAAVEAKPGR